MLQVKRISKQYKTGDLVQKALDEVSLNLRENEFVAILGPSGSGKTTLLNIIGGLDRYDSGDLIINGISTKKYKDRDWDSYRNHTVGFVFQSYFLIPHQTVLGNVELALTISGVSKAARRKKAIEALEKVGLGDQLHKKPNQMSGGQMQRVAIARALVNDPDILLADEPTGALDTNTSVQVMELLKEVAHDRLVVMVTHNPELAAQYATRTITLKDGKITGDTNEYVPDSEEIPEPVHKNMGKSSMSFFTSLALSARNLTTKKGRTLLTAFAGSIGIIGIALILSLSNGINNYINDIQKSTMSSYPIQIDEQTMDISSMFSITATNAEDETVQHDFDSVYTNNETLQASSQLASSIVTNNLEAFKVYLDNPDSAIHDYVGENGIVYTYNTKFNIFAYDPNGEFINTDGSTFNMDEQTITANNMSYTRATTGNNYFSQMLPGSDSLSVSSSITDNYDMVYGNWPESYDEVVIVLDKNNEISTETLNYLGYFPAEDFQDTLDSIEAGEDVEFETESISYDDILNQEFILVPQCDNYTYNETTGYYQDVSDDNSEMEAIAQNGIKLHIVGIIKPNENSENSLISGTVGYTKALTDYIIEYTEQSDVVTAQIANADVNVMSGLTFSPKSDEQKIEDTANYIEGLSISDKAQFVRQMLQMSEGVDESVIEQMNSMSEEDLASMADQMIQTSSDETILAIYDSLLSPGSYDDNLSLFGVVDPNKPSSISIYADSFEDKDNIAEAISDYNEQVSEEDKISYTDYVALLMSSVTTIVNVISYVLIAFVAVSLVVSSIMIGIITYISVLERTKEIGILRAIGASKKNISNVFNAETFIIGLISGLIGVGVSLLALIPANSIIHSLTDNYDINAALPVSAAIALILLSMVLTLVGGLIPSKKAAKMDPVSALRSE